MRVEDKFHFCVSNWIGRLLSGSDLDVSQVSAFRSAGEIPAAWGTFYQASSA